MLVVDVELLVLRLSVEHFTRRVVQHLDVRLPLLSQQLTDGGRECVDEDQPDDIIRVGPGVQLGDHAAPRVGDEYVGAGNFGDRQQSVQVGDGLGNRARHLDGT